MKTTRLTNIFEHNFFQSLDIALQNPFWSENTVGGLFILLNPKKIRKKEKTHQMGLITILNHTVNFKCFEGTGIACSLIWVFS